jgi:2-polyprenyl-6-methoxyphenol hydroxylase-like FAD-dependent oxidoreductase
LQKWVSIHRIDLHEALKNAVTNPNDTDTPAIILTSSRIVDVDASAGTITLDSGERISGDMVIGADGIGVRNPFSITIF